MYNGYEVSRKRLKNWTTMEAYIAAKKYQKKDLKRRKIQKLKTSFGSFYVVYSNDGYIRVF